MSVGLSYSLEQITDSVPEKDKLKYPYLRGNIDKAISDLVYEKSKEQLAYNTYLGKRSENDMQHLTDNYGVGLPNEIPSMRLMSKRINTLVGKMMQNQLDYGVTCTNPGAIDAKMQEKKEEILREMAQHAAQNIGKESLFSEHFQQRLKAKYGEHWQASFEIAVFHYLKYFTQRYDMEEHGRQHGKDLCNVGQMYNRVFVRELGRDPEYWACDPRNLFFDSSPDGIWIRNKRRVVYRRYMSPHDILHELGPMISDEDYDSVARALNNHYNERFEREFMYIENRNQEDMAVGEIPRFQSDLIEVYHVEWLATNRVDGDTDSIDLLDSKDRNIKQKGTRFRTDRYEGYRISIGNGIYAAMGKSKHIARSQRDPYRCTLTYDGLTYNSERAYVNEPFSLVLATKDLSDIYDITYFQLNNLLAAARPGGTFTVLEHIPKEFGDTPEERIKKNAGYEKVMSQKVISLSQEGMEEVPFNNYGNYPSNLDGSLVQAYVEYIKILEQQADSMLGLNPRMMGEMEERDGKGTTMMAITQGEIITKELFHLYNIFMRATLERIANEARVAHQNGFFTSYMLGSDHKVFQLRPETFSIFDFNVFLTDSMEDKQIKMSVDQLAMTAIQAKMTNLKEAFELLNARTLSEKKRAMDKMDDSTQQQVDQQLQQLQQQLEQLGKENEQLKKQVEKGKNEEIAIKREELELKRQELAAKINVDREELEHEREADEREQQIEQEKVEVERQQLFNNTKRDDDVNWSK